MTVATIIRRSRSAMKLLREQMRRLEAEGKQRSEIARLTDSTPAQVTRALGPVRPWRGRRLAA